MIKTLEKTKTFIAVFFSMCFLLTNMAFALDIVLEPANAKREIGGKVRMHIYADNAVNLISMGVKVSFNPAVLQVDSASKYEESAETGWVMDADGDSGTTSDQYRPLTVAIENSAGTVTMLGGNINGTATTGFSGKVLLGWIVFNAVGNGNSNINVDLAKYHPNHPEDKFDNFVQLNGTVDEPGNVVQPGGTDLGLICVIENACEGDYNNDGSVTRTDSRTFKRSFDTSFGDADYNPASDFNGDASITRTDSRTFKRDFDRTDCPVCE